MTQSPSTSRRRNRSAKGPSFAEAVAPRRKWPWIVGVGLLLVGIVGGSWMAFQPPRRPTTQSVRVVKAYPHDRTAWIQGIVVDEDGTLIEGTGIYGQSTLRRVELDTGRILKRVNLDDRFFGEGITVLGDRIYQLTWKEKVGLIYDRATFRPIDRFPLDGEGWGLTTDGKHLIVSDGSSTLRFLDPETFALVKRLPVTSGSRAVSQLNELEFVEGEIFANVWHQDYVVRIDPATGNVTGVIDMANVYPRRQRTHREHVLNGIAYDAKNKRLFVTGKNWPKLYEVEIVTPR